MNGASHGAVMTAERVLSYIYIYAFSRRFYPKRLTLHSSFYILSALAFPGNRTHDLGVVSAMLYQLSYRKAVAFCSCFLLFKKLAGRGGHHRVIRCSSGMAICLPHEAASRVACRCACILISLICSTISRCRLIKKCLKSSSSLKVNSHQGRWL